MTTSVITKVAGTCKDDGDNVIVVGNGGDFLTLAEAMDYIATQPTMTLVTSSAQVDLTQFENYAPLTTPGTDTLGDIQPGDWLYVSSGDDPNILANTQYDWHYYRILSAIESNTESHPGFLLESCLLGADKAAYTVAVYRSAKFHIKLQSGLYTTTGVTVPDGYDIKISGQGRTTRVGTIDTGDIALTGMSMPIYGHMECTNFLLQAALTGSDTRTMDGGGTGILNAGFDSIDVHDVWVEGQAAIFLGDHSFQSIRVDNIFMSGFKGHRVYCFLHADYMRISNIHYDTVSSMELVEVITHPYRCSTSWTKLADDCYFKRREDVTLPSGNTHSNFVFYIEPPASLHPAYKIEFRRTVIIDDSLRVQADNKGLLGIAAFDNVAVPAKITFIDCELINDDSHDYDIVSEIAATIVATLQIELINSKGYNQRQLTTNFTGATAPIMLFKHTDSAAPLAFNAVLLPAANQADTTVYGVMTSNVTMFDITGSNYGMIRHVEFEQGTGGHTITWSGGKYKVHTNPVGGAGQKAIFSFFYDDTNWVQMNVTTWV